MPTRKSGDDDGTVTDLAAKRAETLAAGRAKGVAASRKRKQERLERPSTGDGRTRWEMYLDGDLPVTEWDDQELGRMQTKNIQGIFAGRPPTLKPQQIREIKAEAQRRGDTLFMRWGPNAIKITAQIMMDRTEPAMARLKAAETFMNRCYGKVPESVKVAVSEAWQEDIDAVMAIMEDGETA
jgi:hypothetical protein